MTIICECGSDALVVVSATEETDENGFVTAFCEQIKCEHCGGRGTERVRNGTKRISGCLVRSSEVSGR